LLKQIRGKEQDRSIQTKFNDGFSLEPVKKQTHFQSNFDYDKMGHISGQSGMIAYSADNEVIPLKDPVRRIFRNNSRDTADTTGLGIDGTVNFGFFPGDVMMEVYQAPADLILYGVGVDIYVWNSDSTTPSLKVEVWRPGTGGYPYLSDGTTYPSSIIDGTGWIGYAHPTDNDTIHYPDTSFAAGLEWNGFANGGTCNNDPEPANGQPLMGTKVLPTSNVDFLITNPGDSSSGLFWVDFTDDGGATFESGEYIAVVVTYLTDGAGDPANADTRIGILSGDAFSIYPYPGTKFYNTDCEGTSGNHGWHIRYYTWRFAYAVDLTGDRGPVFESISDIPTSFSTESRTVTAHITDDNPSGGDAGVASAQILFQLDSLTASINTVEMILISGDEEDGIWEGDIPGQVPGTFVYWNCQAVDVNGNITDAEQQNYPIIDLTSNSLIYYNANYTNIWISLPRLYFYWDSNNFDLWLASYGPMSSELLDYYDTVIEICRGSTIYNNDEVINEWWEGDKTYIVAGDDWLSARSGWENNGYGVMLDILGVSYMYNNINYSSSGDQDGISTINARFNWSYQRII